MLLHQLKPENSIIDKVLNRDKNIMEIADIVRGALLFNNKFDIKEWVDNFQIKYGRYIDKFEYKQKGDDPTYGYYGSYHIDLKINGLLIELQVMSTKLWKYKDAAHDIYDKWRSKPTPIPKIEKALSQALFRMGNESVYDIDIPILD